MIRISIIDDDYLFIDDGLFNLVLACWAWYDSQVCIEDLRCVITSKRSRKGNIC